MLLSVATMQAWLSVTGEDAILLAIEAGVVDFLERHTGRLFTTPAGSVTEVLDGGNHESDPLSFRESIEELPWILLKEEPNGAALTSIKFRSTSDAAWGADEDLSLFELNGRQIYKLDGAYPVGRRNIQVIYPFGYAEDAGPPDAHLAALELVKLKFERRGAGILKSAAIGPMRVTYADVAASGMAEMVDALKRPNLPA